LLQLAKPFNEDELFEKIRVLLKVDCDYEEMSEPAAPLFPQWWN
jgi:hypothetical protein